MTGDVDLLERVRVHLDGRAEVAGDRRVTVGDRVVMVELSDPDHGRLAGLAHRPDAARSGEWPSASEPDEWPDAVPALASLSTAPEPLSRAVGVATLNALSEPEMDWHRGDPMAALSPDVEVVATVGLFRPAFVKFDDVTVRVVERDPPETVDAPSGVTVTTHAPADCKVAFADADCCFVTGSVLLYGGIDRYLAALTDAGVSPVVLVGATASHWPDPVFGAGVDLVAGARVGDPARVRDRVAAGVCGTDLHEVGVEKVYAVRSRDLPGLTLGAASAGATRSNRTTDDDTTDRPRK